MFTILRVLDSGSASKPNMKIGANLIRALRVENYRLHLEIDDILSRSEFVVLDREEAKDLPDVDPEAEAVKALTKLTANWRRH